MADFTFARHVPPSENPHPLHTRGVSTPVQRPPLTAQSTVTHATAAGEKGKHEPVKVRGASNCDMARYAQSNCPQQVFLSSFLQLPAAKPPGLERNKDDPLLTRLLYKGLGKLPK
eukprot:scaffold194567_cov18-Tisochrysis_lutea.AAC.2